MPRKRTIEELEQAAKKAEERANELRAEIEKITQAERAKLRKEIVDAVLRWNESRPDGTIPMEELPEWFDRQTEQNRRKTQEQNNDQKK